VLKELLGYPDVRNYEARDRVGQLSSRLRSRSRKESHGNFTRRRRSTRRSRSTSTGIVATCLSRSSAAPSFRPLLVLIPLLAVVLLLGTFAPQLALFKQLYFKVLRPRGIVKPRPVQDRPEPHNFAQGMGRSRLAVASLFLVPLPVVGLALRSPRRRAGLHKRAFGFCLGCQIYYQLGSLPD